jgi:hypothetical protein
MAELGITGDQGLTEETKDALRGETYVAHSWSHLLELLFSDTWDERISRHRSSYVYRGLPCNSYELRTSLSRLGGPYPDLERHMLRNFRKYAQGISNGNLSMWNWLAIAQHHGLPTRLMDWTYSPMVALHFATSDIESFHKDGVVWGINYVKANQFLPSPLKSVIRDEGSNTFTADMLDGVCANLSDLDALSSEPYVLFLEPPSLSDRITNQYALFSLMNGSQNVLHDWLSNHPSLYFRILIPASLKWEVRDKLDQANITERVLFPGLEGLSNWLKRLYSPNSNHVAFPQ